MAPLLCCTAGWVQERRHLLGRLVVHLDTASIFEILVRLTGAEEQTGMYLPPSKVGPRRTGFAPLCSGLPKHNWISAGLVKCGERLVI